MATSEQRSNRYEVGVFDSGIGGLSVVTALHRLAPALSIRYLADHAYFPYGDRTEAEVQQRARALTARLITAGCRLIVVACNTASSAALERLREEFDVPIVGMEPPLKPAVERSRSGHVAVLVTAQTADGERLARLHETHAGGARVRTIPLPGLADLVEHGEVADARVPALLRDALGALAAAGIDELALGCTHYAFVRSAIEVAVGSNVEVIDASEPVARRVLQQLAAHGSPVPSGEPSAVVCSTTGRPGAFESAIERLRAAGIELPPLRLVQEAAA